jgi:uncharacterized protein YdaL
VSKLIRSLLMTGLFTTLAYLLTFQPVSQGDVLSTKSALILYDAPSDEPKLGLVYAKMLQALLGHFKMNVEIRPVASYLAGQVESHATVFYLGSYYDHPLPDDFLRDVTQTKKRVVWFKYNFWQLTSPRELQFEEKSGISFIDLHGLDAEPTEDKTDPGFFDTVLYKGKSFTKYYRYDAAQRQVMADPDVGIVTLSNPERAKARVMIQDSQRGDKTPYIVQGGQNGNFWYIADIPFSFIGPRDRYLVFCDILHDILGIQHAEKHLALVRLEDVNAKVIFSSIQKLTDYLYSRKIPFSVATIPHYKDPLGEDNNGTPNSIPFTQAFELQKAIEYAQQKGGSLVMHGYTHQYNSMRNPHSGVSADDFEFWNAVANSPVKEDSESWALNRLNKGISEFSEARFQPWAWETPHYQGSPLSYQAMAKRFPTTYQRVFYYTSNHPQLHASGAKKDYGAGMFFPYVIHRDPYGHYVIPENLGNIEYDISAIDPSSNITYTWEDLVTNAEYALVVRDGFASFFFHPFWIDPGFENLHAFADFKKVIEGITRLGYRWTDARDLKLRTENAPQSSATGP